MPYRSSVLTYALVARHVAVFVELLGAAERGVHLDGVVE